MAFLATFKDVVSYIEEFNTFSIIIRLVLACVFGGIIGLEREQKRHSAGFRTFTLVCLGSTLATIANIYLYNTTGSADTSRIAAGVVSGIGFLGVGTIIVTQKNQVKGLTTAACLWVTGCLGIALGSGMIFISVFSFALIFLTMSVLQHFSAYVAAHNRIITLYVEIKEEEDLDVFLAYLREKGYSILTLEKRKEQLGRGHFSVVIEMDLMKKRVHTDVVHELGKVQGVVYIEESRP